MAAVARDGATISYYEHGSGTPTIVFVHPMIYGIGTFQPIVEALCQGSRVITLDPRGTGRSSPLAGPYLLRDHVEDLRAVVEAAVGGPAVLVGLSTGAAVAATFAARYPHLAEKLVLCGGTPAPSNAPNLPYSRDAEFLAYLAHRRSLLDVGDYDGVLQLFFEQAFAEPGTRHLIEGGRQVWAEIPSETVRNFFTAADPDWDLRPLLPAIRCATLVLHGERDRLCALQGARYIARQISGARLHVLKERCHTCHVTATAEFVGVLRRFIRPTGDSEGDDPHEAPAAEPE